ncbi:MAG: UDP-N-acetylmuramoyl-tripeptide--D-alanyl-D-alanine ligase [Bryobacteraceae bacterium]
MKLQLEDVSRAIGSAGTLRGYVSGFSIDSRTLTPGDLFFALRGERYDGHAFVIQALERGAAAAVVDSPVDGNGRLLRVADTLSALQQLARWARQGWGGKIVGVTGSAGKTTTKDVIAALLGSGMNVGKTVGNFNNHFGLPLSILRLPEGTSAAVLELGMNHAGEIRELAKIALPDIGVVTNAGYAHVENFDSIEGVALAKRELIESLPSGGVAVLNADDDRVRQFREVHPGLTVTFGLSPEADVRGEDLEFLESGVRFRAGGARFESPLHGVHGVRNILAGIAVAGIFNLSPAELTEAARSLTPGKMRGERFRYQGITIYNDCYNSNPDAVRSMLDVLRATPARRRIAVLGEMLELGRWAEPLHRDVGRYVVECGITVLVGIRGAARYTVDSAVEAGHDVNAAYFFEDPAEAGERLRGIAEEGDSILFKGSRGTQVERALEQFMGGESVNREFME